MGLRQLIAKKFRPAATTSRGRQGPMDGVDAILSNSVVFVCQDMQFGPLCSQRGPNFSPSSVCLQEVALSFL